MDELEELKKRRLQELQQANAEEVQLQQQIAALETVVKQFLTKEAAERYNTLKTAHPDKAIQLLAILGNAAESGQLRSKIDDEQLKAILAKLSPKRREFKIRRV